MQRHAIPACLFLLLVSASARADEWPEFRGPGGSGHAGKAIPLAWSTTQNVAWKQQVAGKGWSSPIIAEGRVFLTTAVPQAGGDHLLEALCWDVASGKLLWEREVFRQEAKSAPGIHRKNSHASATPVWNGGRLYVHFGHQGTACLDREGKVVWRNQSLAYKPVHGNGGSPIIVGDLLVYCADGGDTQRVVALDRATGALRWEKHRGAKPLKGFSFSTPLAIEVAGQTQVVCAGSNVVSAYLPATGEEVWRVRYDGYSLVPRPVFGNGLVFVCTGFDRPGLLAIRPDGQGDVTDSHVAWKLQKGVSLNPTPLVVGDDLYLISDIGILSCLDTRSGKLHWQERLGGNFSASPLFADGKIYVQDEDGVGTVLRAGSRFEKLSRNVMEERTLASCAAAGGALFLRTENHLYRIADGSRGTR